MRHTSAFFCILALGLGACEYGDFSSSRTFRGSNFSKGSPARRLGGGGGHSAPGFRGGFKGLDSKSFDSFKGSVGNLRVGSDDFIEGQGVNKVTGPYDGGKFPTGEPRAIVLHKTGGTVCEKNSQGETVTSEEHTKPHITICRDGTIVSHGSLEYARDQAERGHNGYTLNIEFDSRYVGHSRGECERKGYPVPVGGKNCYESITAAQAEAGKQAIRLMSQHHNIPLKPIVSHDQHMKGSLYVSTKGGGLRSDSSRVRGVMNSHSTVITSPSEGINHDDWLDENEWERLGIGAV